MIGVRYLQIFLLSIGCFISTGIKTNVWNTILLMIDKREHQHNVKLSDECVAWSSILALIFFSIVLMKYNNRIIVVIIILCSGLLNVLIPTLIINIGWWASVFCLIAVIFGLSVVDVFIHNFMSRWVPISERASLGAVVFSGISLGPLFYSLTIMTSFQSTYGLAGIYYMHGIVAIVWSLLFLFLGANYPSEHRFISQAEVRYIESNPDPSMRTHYEFPWKRMVTSLPAWALLFCISGHEWSYYVFNNYSFDYIYLDYDIFSKIDSEYFYIASYLVLALVLPAAGVLSDIFIRSNVSVELVRKVANTVGMWGSAVLVFLLYILKIKDENAVITFVIAIRALNVVVYCGYMLNAMDMCPNSPGTLFGIIYAVAKLYSYLMLKISVSFIQNEAVVLCMAIVISLVANGIFIIFGKSENQQWEKSISTTNFNSPTYPNSTNLNTNFTTNFNSPTYPNSTTQRSQQKSDKTV